MMANQSSNMHITYSEHNNPVFIIGILQRSGTNYLNNLLLLHPDVHSPGLVWEDFFLAPSEHLEKYIEGLHERWNEKWRNAVESELGHNALLNHLGDGLISFMKAQFENRLHKSETSVEFQNPIRLVTATPVSRNIKSFFELFPKAAPIIIVRDGRAVVETGVKSFGWDYEEAMHMWASSALRISEFCNNKNNAGRYLLTRYEDLYINPEEEMHRILEFLGLDATRYDFHKAKNLGVMGSSDLKNDGESLHWKYVDKPSNFDPLSRASNWGHTLHKRFNWIAGTHMQELGYKLQHNEGNSIYQHRWNLLLDALYSLETKSNQRSKLVRYCLRKLRRGMLSPPYTRSSG